MVNSLYGLLRRIERIIVSECIIRIVKPKHSKLYGYRTDWSVYRFVTIEYICGYTIYDRGDAERVYYQPQMYEIDIQ